jgi:hypothetical protein
MNIRRKIQLGALAVIANGLLAASMMAPRPAHAACADQYYCAGFCPADATAACQSVFGPLGCTAEAGVCVWTDQQPCPKQNTVFCNLS